MPLAEGEWEWHGVSWVREVVRIEDELDESERPSRSSGESG